MDYKTFALQLAQEAGKIIRKNFMLGMKKEWKEDNTPLTETDLAINKLVLDSIKKEFPSHSLIAEEESNFNENSEFVWVCDPLDGTIPFSHGIPTCVFSLALVKKGEVILGVVYDPFMDRMFFAEKSKGAFLNNKKIHVSDSKTIKSKLTCVVPRMKKAPYDLSDFAKELMKREAIPINLMSITYMGALVANGEFIATAFPETHPHDTAALKVIVEEAGGKVTDLFGNEQRYDRDIKGHLITNGLIHKELVELIKKTVKIM